MSRRWHGFICADKRFVFDTITSVLKKFDYEYKLSKGRNWFGLPHFSLEVFRQTKFEIKIISALFLPGTSGVKISPLTEENESVVKQFMGDFLRESMREPWKYEKSSLAQTLRSVRWISAFALSAFLLWIISIIGFNLPYTGLADFVLVPPAIFLLYLFYFSWTQSRAKDQWRKWTKLK
ncbi:MAG: hypothetical protein OEX16_05575 [Hadesarchaea archaeon]|nr:hypothetical protein [Hadesarchaea archaeon]